MTLSGGCYCGKIRYEASGGPENALQCHCRECQYFTGGNANLVVIFSRDQIRFTKGAPKKFARPDLDRPATRLFCPDCGTGIGTESPNRPDSLIIKVGTLDDPSGFVARAAIFTCDKQSYHHIPDDVPQFEKRPPVRR